jgi:hypothetical protein
MPSSPARSPPSCSTPDRPPGPMAPDDPPIFEADGFDQLKPFLAISPAI